MWGSNGIIHLKFLTQFPEHKCKTNVTCHENHDDRNAELEKNHKRKWRNAQNIMLREKSGFKLCIKYDFSFLFKKEIKKSNGSH